MSAVAAGRAAGMSGLHRLAPAIRQKLALPSPRAAGLLLLACLAVPLLVSRAQPTLGMSAVLWPEAAILLAAVLRHPPGAWPALLLLGGVADTAAGLLQGLGPPSALGRAAVDAGEALGAALLLRRTEAGGCLASVRGVLRLVLAFGLAAAGGSAVVALLAGGIDGSAPGSGMSGQEALGWAWQAWYPARALGLLIVTPLLLSWADWTLRPEDPGPDLPTALLAAGLAVAVSTAALVLGWPALGRERLPLLLPAFPLLLLTALRAGLPVALAATAALALTATGLAAAQPAAPDPARALQLHLAALLLTILLATAAVVEEAAARHAAEAVGRAKTDFLAVMSHELRTPLTALLGTIDTLAAASSGSAPAELVPAPALAAARAAGQQLLDTVAEVLDLGKLETVGTAIEPVAFRLDELIEEVAAVGRFQARARGLSLTVRRDGDVPPVLVGDPRRIRQVLLNLLANALRFTAAGGVTLAVGAGSSGDGASRVRFAVEDTGIGLTPEQQERLFRPFAQADATIERRFGGTGLGLAIAKRLVEAMGGGIGVESEPGRGSTFWFELPLAAGEIMVEKAEAKPLSGVATSASGLRILVAEDAAASRVLIKEMLTRAGHVVTVVPDGSAALAEMARGDFDVVLLDVHLPGTSGLEIARRIRRLPSPAGSVPILALTASALEVTRRHCQEAGMDDFVPKPIDWPRLLRLLAACAEPQHRTGRSPPNGQG